MGIYLSQAMIIKDKKTWGARDRNCVRVRLVDRLLGCGSTTLAFLSTGKYEHRGLALTIRGRLLLVLPLGTAVLEYTRETTVALARAR